jgi:transcription antitermination factor NusG
MTQSTESVVSAAPAVSQKAKLEELVARARQNLEAQKAKLAAKPKPEAKDLKLDTSNSLRQVVAGNIRAEKKAASLAAKNERLAKREARRIVRAEKKAAKAAEREAKASKGDKATLKAAAKLPTLDANLAALVAQIVECTSAHSASISAVVDHLRFAANVAGRAQAKNVEVEPGDTVRIVGGRPQFVGMVGVVERAAKLRCHVMVPGKETTIYLFNSDVEVVNADEVDDAPSKEAAAKEVVEDVKFAPDANILDGADDEAPAELACERLIALGLVVERSRAFSHLNRTMKVHKNKNSPREISLSEKAQDVTDSHEQSRLGHQPKISVSLSTSHWLTLYATLHEVSLSINEDSRIRSIELLKRELARSFAAGVENFAGEKATRVTWKFDPDSVNCNSSNEDELTKLRRCIHLKSVSDKTIVDRKDRKAKRRDIEKSAHSWAESCREQKDERGGA